MTPSDADTPLTAEELALYRQTFYLPYHSDSEVISRLLATLDATRAAPGLREALEELGRIEQDAGAIHDAAPPNAAVDDVATIRDIAREIAKSAYRARTALSQPEAGIDVERLMEAMNEAYQYADRDNVRPELPFVDDVEAFWTPFAEKVAAEYARLTAPGKPDDLNPDNWPVVDPDYMCPNCVTPWKCNGPHIPVPA